MAAGYSQALSENRSSHLRFGESVFPQSFKRELGKCTAVPDTSEGSGAPARRKRHALQDKFTAEAAARTGSAHQLQMRNQRLQPRARLCRVCALLPVGKRRAFLSLGRGPWQERSSNIRMVINLPTEFGSEKALETLKVNDYILATL